MRSSVRVWAGEMNIWSRVLIVAVALGGPLLVSLALLGGLCAAAAETRDPREAAVAQLTHVSPAVRRQAVFTLSKFNDPQVIPVFMNAINDADPFVRLEAVRALGEFKDPQVLPTKACSETGSKCKKDAVDPRVIPALSKAMDDKHARVRERVVTIFQNSEPDFSNPLVLSVLTKAMEDADVKVRCHAAMVWGASQDPQAISPLLKALDDPDLHVRRLTAEQGLRQFKDDPRVLPALLKAINDSDSRVRLAAVAWVDCYRDPQALPVLTKALEHNDSAVRKAVAKALSKFNNPQALQALTKALEHSDSAVRKAAVMGLGKSPHPIALTVLTKVLDDSDVKVRQAAVKALGALKDARALPALTKAMNDSDSAVRQAVAEELGTSQRLFVPNDPQALLALMKAAGDPEAKVRLAAVTALGSIGDPRALLQEDAVVRVEVTALGSIGDPRALLTALAKALDDADPEVRKMAAWAVLQCCRPPIDDPTKTIHHPDLLVRLAGVEALASGGERTTPFLRQALKDPDPAVQAAARRALEAPRKTDKDTDDKKKKNLPRPRSGK